MTSVHRAWIGWGALIVGGIISSVLMILTAIWRQPTALELVLYQVLSLSLGFIGSYMIGRLSSRRDAQESVRPLGRSAINRVLSIGQGFKDIAIAIEGRRAFLRSIAAPDVSMPHVEQSLDLLAGLVVTQTRIAADAIQDWQEIVPERVAELARRAEEVSQ